MIFPPHNVAKAILTANTEILPWPSLFNDDRKKEMSCEERPITQSDIFCSVETIGQQSCMHYVNISILKKVMNTFQHMFLKNSSSRCFLFSRDCRIFKLFFVYAPCSKHRLVAIEICAIYLERKITEHSFHFGFHKIILCMMMPQFL